MTPKQIVASYLIVQAVGTAAWWCLLWLYPLSIEWFRPGAWPDETLLGFWLSDLSLLVGGSTMTAVAVMRNRTWASLAVWSLAAAVWYPTLYCIGVSVMTGEAWIASAMMVSMAGLTLAMATIHGRSDQRPATIRPAALTRTSALVWTLAQTLIFWSAFLWILPKGIVELEQRLGWTSFSDSGHSTVAVIAFAAASLLGLWSGIAMAIVGDGTPLPTAAAPRLVITGPYCYVRNPMALAGILQGIAMGWLLGSWSVIAYSLAGAVIWHLFVRPVEETDLANRFGEEYLDYRNRVGLWMPRIPSKSEAKPASNEGFNTASELADDSPASKN